MRQAIATCWVIPCTVLHDCISGISISRNHLDIGLYPASEISSLRCLTFESLTSMGLSTYQIIGSWVNTLFCGPGTDSDMSWQELQVPSNPKTRVCVYIYIYRERERGRGRARERGREGEEVQTSVRRPPVCQDCRRVCENKVMNPSG